MKIPRKQAEAYRMTQPQYDMYCAWLSLWGLRLVYTMDCWGEAFVETRPLTYNPEIGR